MLNIPHIITKVILPIKNTTSLFFCLVFSSTLFFNQAFAEGLTNNISNSDFAPQLSNQEQKNFNQLSHNSRSWEGINKKTEIKNLNVYEKDNFRVFYYTKGIDKVDLKDKNKNNVSDYVEDVVKQMWATQHVFCDLLGFPHPFETKYYKNVDYIDIFIIAADKLNGATGTTFIAPVQSLLKPEGTKSIKILLSKGFHFAASTTITHEFFHVIQNGMSHIKNLWYLEGLARWSEDLLHKKNYGRDPRWNYYKLIKNKDVLNHVHSLSYDAGKFFWIPLTIQLTKDKKYFLDKDHPLLTLKYSNNSPVIQDTHIAGVQFVKLFLSHLSTMDSRIAKKIKNFKWTDNSTHHIRNNPYIMEAVNSTIKEMKAIEKRPVRSAMSTLHSNL